MRYPDKSFLLSSWLRLEISTNTESNIIVSVNVERSAEPLSFVICVSYGCAHLQQALYEDHSLLIPVGHSPGACRMHHDDRASAYIVPHL